MFRVMVYGGRGALGAKIVEKFKDRGHWVLNVDVAPSEFADENVVVDAKVDVVEQEKSVIADLASKLPSGQKLHAIFCVAGGWAGGNAANEFYVKNTDTVFRQSVWSSVLAARIASLYLENDGLLQLTGAAAAVDSTPGMIGYGMAKAAVHHLTRSLAEESGGLPEGATVLALLPVTLDTPMNRKWMPKANQSNWTPLEYVSNLLLSYMIDPSLRPPTGALMKLETASGVTEITFVHSNI